MGRRLAGLRERDRAAVGGIATWEEIDALEAIGVDAVVGMALYAGTLDLRR